MSRTAACEQYSSMSQAAPHELDRFKGQTAADKKDWCRSRAETREQDRSIRAGQRQISRTAACEQGSSM